jgi:hyaluronoglucosaminidase
VRRPITACLLISLGWACIRVPAAPAARSPFPIRGVIEGFYGPPFSHADRLDLISWGAGHGLNTYVHAPKFDPYIRAQWREQYPVAALADYLQEVRAARRVGVAWVPDVGPGVAEIPSPGVPDRDICFSCPGDLDALVAKFRPFVEAGATAVMVSFDDTLKASTHPEDAAAYGTGDAAYGAMNADLLNHLAARLTGVRVFTVPADYSGTATTTYLRAFGAHLDRRVVVMWTGTAVVSKTITAAQANAFGAAVHRKVLVWDNYPANDYAGGIAGSPVNLYLGPYEGRGSDLAGAITGVVANPMAEWAADKVALATMADDLADPWHYDAERSWRRSLADAGGDDARALTKLGENTRSSPLDGRESVVFEAAASALLSSFATGRWPVRYGALQAELADESAAATALLHAGDAELARDVGPFARRLGINAAAGAAAARLATSERPALTARAVRRGGTVVVSGVARPPSAGDTAGARTALISASVPMLADVHNVHGVRLAPSLDSGVVAGQNRMDAFVSRVVAMDAAWLPSAGAATSSVRVTVNGRPVAATFSVVVPAGGPVVVTATDGAGGRTEVVLQATRAAR